jgi:hypothetical protein
MKSTTTPIAQLVTLALLLIFHTAVRAQNCSDLNEPNNNYTQATPITPGENDHGLINPTGDVDVFSFNVTQDAPNVQVVLSNLPTNYDLKLYQSNGQQVGVSKHRGKTNDTIIKNNTAAGTYYARVYGNNGKFDPDYCFVIKVNTSNVPYKYATENKQTTSGFTVSVYPNPATSTIIILAEGISADAVLSVFELSGRKVMRDISLSPQAVQESPVDVSALPAGTYLIRVESSNDVAVKKLLIQR